MSTTERVQIIGTLKDLMIVYHQQNKNTDKIKKKIDSLVEMI